MKKIFLSSLVFVSFVIKTHAYEVDQFTRRDEVPKDSIEILDREINARISEALDKANSGFFREGCNSKDPAKREESLTKLLKNLKDQLVNGSLDTGNVEEFAKGSKEIAKRKIATDESIYKSVQKILNFQEIKIDQVINVGGTQIGISKLGNFFTKGYSIHLNNIKRIEKPNLIRESLLDSLGRTSTSLTTGIKSYADMAANYDGQKFWAKLCGLKRTEDSTFCEADSYLRCGENGKWAFNPAKKLTLKDFITSAWDESINCNSFDPKISDDVFDNMNKKAYLYKGNPLQPCPAEPQKCAQMTDQYEKNVVLKIVNPICRRVSKSLKNNKKIDPSKKFDYTYQIDNESLSAPAEANDKKSDTKKRQ